MVRIRTLVFGANYLREMVKRHEETISDCANKHVIIAEIPISYSNVRFAVHRGHSFFFEQIQSTVLNMCRVTE